MSKPGNSPTPLLRNSSPPIDPFRLRGIATLSSTALPNPRWVSALTAKPEYRVRHSLVRRAPGTRQLSPRRHLALQPSCQYSLSFISRYPGGFYSRSLSRYYPGGSLHPFYLSLFGFIPVSLLTRFYPSLPLFRFNSGGFRPVLPSTKSVRRLPYSPAPSRTSGNTARLLSTPAEDSDCVPNFG